MAAAVKQTSGAIGYVEQAYALENGFTYAAVKNSGGAYVLPTIPNTSAAFLGVTIPPDLGISTINSPNPGAYPIVSQTFLDAYKDPCKDGKASASVASGLKKFLTYAFGAGQKTLGAGSSQLPYAPVPSSLADKDNTQLGDDDLQRIPDLVGIRSGGKRHHRDRRPLDSRAVAGVAASGPHPEVGTDRPRRGDPGAARVLLHPSDRTSRRARSARTGSASSSANDWDVRRTPSTTGFRWWSARWSRPRSRS